MVRIQRQRTQSALLSLAVWRRFAVCLLLLPAVFFFSMAVADGIKYGTSRVARNRADRGVKKVAVGINCEADARWWSP